MVGPLRFAARQPASGCLSRRSRNALLPRIRPCRRLLTSATAESLDAVVDGQSMSLAYNYFMKIEWDAAKEQANRTRHGISFQ
jgi:hypothetical protein